MMKARILRGIGALGCAAALLYVIGCSPSTPGDETSFTRFRVGELAELKIPGEKDPPNPKAPELPVETSPAAAPAPDTEITGPDGGVVKIADMKGQVTLVNLWATWCAPCKVEMPTLAKLQADYAGKPVTVMAISTDAAEDLEAAKVELAASAPLKFYHVEGLTLPYAFTPTATSFPTTVIYDKQGVERARLVGDADWSKPEVKALVDALLAEG